MGKHLQGLTSPKVLNVLGRKYNEAHISKAPHKLQDDTKQKEEELEETI